jgi:hypothetical protein
VDGSLGLSDVVAGHYELDDALVAWNRGQVTVLPAGTTPPDPGQLLGSHAMEEVLSELRSRFDLVIIDAPPLLPVSDAVVLGGISDGVIVVARYRHVRKEQITLAVEHLRAANATVLGTILTLVPAKVHGAQYGDDYDYAHPGGPSYAAAEEEAAHTDSTGGSDRAESGQVETTEVRDNTESGPHDRVSAEVAAVAAVAASKDSAGRGPRDVAVTAPEAVARPTLVHPPTKPAPGSSRGKQVGGTPRSTGSERR